MSELSLDALSWQDKAKVLQLHPLIQISGITEEYRRALLAAKDKRDAAGIVPIEQRKAQ